MVPDGANGTTCERRQGSKAARPFEPVSPEQDKSWWRRTLCASHDLTLWWKAGAAPPVSVNADLNRLQMQRKSRPQIIPPVTSHKHVPAYFGETWLTRALFVYFASTTCRPKAPLFVQDNGFLASRLKGCFSFVALSRTGWPDCTETGSGAQRDRIQNGKKKFIDTSGRGGAFRR